MIITRCISSIPTINTSKTYLHNPITSAHNSLWLFISIIITLPKLCYFCLAYWQDKWEKHPLTTNSSHIFHPLKPRGHTTDNKPSSMTVISIHCTTPLWNKSSFCFRHSSPALSAIHTVLHPQHHGPYFLQPRSSLSVHISLSSPCSHSWHASFMNHPRTSTFLHTQYVAIPPQDLLFCPFSRLNSW